jgi:uncharacterized protein YbjT (DUF2867 family)
MPKKITAVMGATGHIGSALSHALLAKGHEVRALGRDAGRLFALASKGAKTRTAAFDDAKALAEAFRGADAVFAMIPPSYGEEDFGGYQDRVGAAIVQALRSSGVKRAVSLSSTGAQHAEGTGLIRGLHRQEKRLNATNGLDVVHLRPSYFMENHFWSVGTIKNAGINGSPIATDLVIPQVATADIAARAADFLDRLDFLGSTIHEFGGPRDLTMAEVTSVLGRAIGKPDLKYVQFSYADAEKAMLGMGMKPGLVALMIEMQRGMNEGRVAMERPLAPAQRGATSIEDFAPGFAAAFKS